MKDASKKLSKKFATGASITTDTNIEMQGDLADDVYDFLLATYPEQLSKKTLEVLDGKYKS